MEQNSRSPLSERDESLSTRQVSIRDGEINSQELFQSERELRVRHGKEIYRLRLTGLNKLILTK